MKIPFWNAKSSRAKQDIDRFNIDKLSEGAKALVYSMVMSPEKWNPCAVKQPDGTSPNDADVWSDENVIIINKETKYYGSYNMGGNKIGDASGFIGFVVASPHVQYFEANEQKILREAFKYMIGKRTELVIMGSAPMLTHAELIEIAEDLIKNNKGYVLTSSNDKLRKWGERLLKSSSAE